jgi:hypothetical protein
MRLKLRAAIVVLLLMVASLSIAGCTTSPTSTTNQTSTSAATQNTFLENYLTEYKLNRSSEFNISAWDLEWTNSTAAHLRWSAVNKSTSQVESWNETFIVFATTQDASNYINVLNRTAYSVGITEYPGGAYQKTTGHAPQVFKDYVWNEGNQLNVSEYTHHEIVQLDNVVVISTTSS